VDNVHSAGVAAFDDVEMWAGRIAAAADLPDQRLNTRLASILATFARQPKDSIPQSADDWQQAKGTYRFFQNKRFDYEPLVQALADTTAATCAGYDHIYLAHDSSSLNYGTLKSTTGLGRLSDSNNACGLLLHSVLAITNDGIVRGLMDVDLWHRPVGTRTHEQRYERPFEEKESFKWVRGIRAVSAAFAGLPAQQRRPRRVHLMDREGDVHEVFAEVLAQGDGAVIRCAQNRKVAGPVDRAHAAVAASPLLGITKLKISEKIGPARKQRQATLQLRALPVRLTPSQRDYPGRQSLQLNLMEAREIDAPLGSKPVRWLLWTTEPIATWKDLLERLREYSLRWRIEEYHLTLKSGCNTEGLLLETAGRLSKAIVLYAAVATRIVTLRDLGRHCPDAPCTALLSEEEWRVLARRFDGDTGLPSKPPTIRQAMQWIGQLGGHLGRKRDGLPGVRTLWRGWRDLALLVEGYRLSQCLSR
jgi:hypothetical protein